MDNAVDELQEVGSLVQIFNPIRTMIFRNLGQQLVMVKFAQAGASKLEKVARCLL